MFDVGFLEVLVIGIVALIVIGPEKLPAVARTVGAWVGKMQRFVRGVKSDFASELQSGDLKKIIGDQNDQISELRNLVNNARQDFKAGVDEATSTTRTSMEDFNKMVEEGKAEEAQLDGKGSNTTASSGSSTTSDTVSSATSEASTDSSIEASTDSSTGESSSNSTKQQSD